MNSLTKLRVVIDTNVFISGLNWGGKPGLILKKWLNDKFSLLVSPYLVVEIITTYERFNNPKEDIEKLKKYLITKTINITPSKKITVCRDENDNQILDLCFFGKADFLITGDRDLLTLKEFEKTKIINPREFLKQRYGK